MEEFLGLHTWGTDLILWIQQWQTPLLDTLFVNLSRAELYLLLMPIAYWCINRTWGLRLLYLAAFTTWCAETVKLALKLPRPDPTIVRQMVIETSYGFPSNHALTLGVILWGYAAAHVRRLWFAVLAVAMMLLIGFSRPYLGIHFPQDVLGGWTMGLILLAIALAVESPLAAWWHRQATGTQVAVAVLLPLALLFITPADRAGHYPAEIAGTLSGIMLGIGLGAIGEARTVRFRTEGTLIRRLLRYPVGLGLVLIVGGIGQLLPSVTPWALDLAIRVLRFAAVGLTLVWLAPWVFVRIGLAEGEVVEQGVRRTE